MGCKAWMAAVEAYSGFRGWEPGERGVLDSHVDRSLDAEVGLAFWRPRAVHCDCDLGATDL